MKIALILLLAFGIVCDARIEDHFRKVEKKSDTPPHQLKKIDFIYLINPDYKTEKLSYCLWQLQPYYVVPCRFPAVTGRSLSPSILKDVGLQFGPEMEGNRWATAFTPEMNQEYLFLNSDSYGKTVFSRFMSASSIGNTLSHLSVLQDAYDSGYETIWVMEDEMFVVAPLECLSDLIVKLDTLVGKEGWDVLYTDLDIPDKPVYTGPNDFETDLHSTFWWMWRPDCGLPWKDYAKRTIVSEDFIQVGSRMRTHSMIIRRSGMKKILDFEKSHRIFAPYDHELALVPELRMYCPRYPLVSFSFSIPER